MTTPRWGRQRGPRVWRTYMASSTIARRCITGLAEAEADAEAVDAQDTDEAAEEAAEKLGTGSALPAARGWRCALGCMPRVSPQRMPRSSRPTAKLSGICASMSATSCAPSEAATTSGGRPKVYRDMYT